MKRFVATVSLYVGKGLTSDDHKDVVVGAGMQVSDSSPILFFIDTLPIDSSRWNGTVKLTEQVQP